MPAPFPSPVVRSDASLDIDGVAVDLAVRVLVAGVVPEPRFGREAEVAATARSVADAGADLVDVSLAPRLVGPAVRAVPVPVVVRAESVDAAAAAARAGAALILMPVALLRDVAAGISPSAPSPPAGVRVPALAALVDDPSGIADARAVADQLGVPLGLDSSRWSGAEAIAREADAVADGCRILRTADVRRSRRIAEVMTAILAARRDPATTPAPTPSPHVDDEGLR